MRSLRTWRFTALLGILAALGAAGVVTWAMSVGDNVTASRRANPGRPAVFQEGRGGAFASAPPATVEVADRMGDHGLLDQHPLWQQASIDDSNPLTPNRPAGQPMPGVPEPQSNPQSAQPSEPLSGSTAIPLPKRPPGVSRPAVRTGQAPPVATRTDHAKHATREHKPEGANAVPSKPANRQAGRPTRAEKNIEPGDPGAAESRPRR
jgi:hypothetical protein